MRNRIKPEQIKSFCDSKRVNGIIVMTESAFRRIPIGYIRRYKSIPQILINGEYEDINFDRSRELERLR